MRYWSVSGLADAHIPYGRIHLNLLIENKLRVLCKG